MRLLSLLCLLALGCESATGPDPDDADGDGFGAAEDCDDDDASVNPDAIEVCDRVDNDCDGRLDLEATDATAWFPDGDGDAHGDGAAGVQACAAPTGHVAAGDDCDDADPARFPGNPELCDALDNDCDDAVDEDPADAPAWYPDGDGDGWGRDEGLVRACAAPGGHSDQGGDCDDGNTAVHPGAAEGDCTDPTDYNCDGSVGYADGDGDGSPACQDCDDGDATRSPTLPERCDAADVDEDCDGRADDDDDPLPASESTWWPDVDGDGSGDPAGPPRQACDERSGYAAVADDCDDTRSEVHPGATERCDELATDEDCDGLVDDEDDSVDPGSWSVWFVDADNDAYGEASGLTAACDQPVGYAAEGTDCDDTDPATNPGALELCDELDADEDCDGLADDDDVGAVGASSWFADADGDGQGDAATSLETCESSPLGYVDNPSDCDDTDAYTYEGAATAELLYDCTRDADGDGYGDSAASGAVVPGTDCDDTDAGISPGAPEQCLTNIVDDDCDGEINDLGAVDCITLHYDGDLDGYGVAPTECRCTPEGGYTSIFDDDCDDADPAAFPGNPEVCDDLADNDCDGAADEDCALDPLTGAMVLESGATADSQADAILYGEASADYFGEHLASGGDLDGDGADDFAVGSDGNNYGAYLGSVYVHSGMPTGVAEADDHDVARIYGSITTNTLPDGLWMVPDMDSDGIAELAIRRTSGTAETVYLYEGEDLSGAGAYNAGAWLYDDFTLTGPVAGLGDEDAASGNDEVGIANYEASSNQGAIYLYAHGSAGLASLGTVNGEDAADYAGRTFAGGTDANGDGYDDLMVGAYGDDSGGANAGAAYVVEAPVSGTYDLSSAAVKIVGDAGDNLGYTLHAPGDLDGDGRADLIAGAPSDDGAGSDAGAIYLFEDVNPDGTSRDNDDGDHEAVIWGAASSDQLGQVEIASGDVNGDGEVDLLFSSSRYDSSGGASAGAAWLVYGPLAGTYDLSAGDYDAIFEGDSASDACGSAVAIGDLQADGAAELLIGCSSGDADAYTQRGTVYVFEGR